MTSPWQHAAAALTIGEFSGFVVSPELRNRIISEWGDFRQRAEALGFDAPTHRTGPFNPENGDEWDYAAHDFMLTRNYEGAGFWDGDWLDPWGQVLTNLAHTYTSVEVYVGDHDNMLYAI